MGHLTSWTHMKVYFSNYRWRFCLSQECRDGVWSVPVSGMHCNNYYKLLMAIIKTRYYNINTMSCVSSSITVGNYLNTWVNAIIYSSMDLY